MRIAIVGAGAIGAYVGASLARGGADVHLIARGKHLDAIRRNGVTVHSPRGDFVTHPPATDDSHEIERCYELGCNVYITKPVNYESFANAIRQLGLFFSVIQVPSAAR